MSLRMVTLVISFSNPSNLFNLLSSSRFKLCKFLKRYSLALSLIKFFNKTARKVQFLEANILPFRYNNLIHNSNRVHNNSFSKILFRFYHWLVSLKLICKLTQDPLSNPWAQSRVCSHSSHYSQTTLSVKWASFNQYTISMVKLLNNSSSNIYSPT